jgi:tetratricopeptide (TPR) repeat protein
MPAVSLTRGEKELLAKRHTENAQAYQACILGRYFWSKRTYDGLQRAIEYFNQAIAIDPHYALAYAGLADTYNTFGGLGFLPQKEASPKASEMATKALELDDKLAPKHMARWPRPLWTTSGIDRKRRSIFSAPSPSTRATPMYTSGMPSICRMWGDIRRPSPRRNGRRRWIRRRARERFVWE